jgi:DNA-binding NtrC family response regulator
MDASATILVADRDPSILQLLQTILTGMGHEVLLASDDEKVLSLADEHPVDVALLDIELPVLGGTGVARELARKKPDVVVTLMSTAGSARSGLTELALGIRRHLFKPLEDTAQVERVVSDVLEERARRLHQRLTLDGGDANAESDDAGDPVHVLVADTNDQDRAQIRDALKALSCEIKEATCAQEALLLLNKGRHDVLVVAYDMGDMTADDVLLRAKRLDDGVAIVVTAAAPTLSMTTSLIKRGAAGFVEKPLKDAARTARAIVRQARAARAEREEEEEEGEEADQDDGGEQE